MRRTFYIILIAVFASQLTLGVVNIILPLYFRSLQLDMTRLNLIFTLFEFGMLFSMPFIGKMSDIFGRRPVVIFSLLLHTVVSFFNVLAVKIWHFAILRAIRAIASTADNVISPAYVHDLFKKGRGIRIGFLQSFRHSGLAIGGIIGGVVLAFLGFKASFYIISLITLLAFFIAYTGLKEPKREEVQTEKIGRNVSPELFKLAIISAVIWIGIRAIMPTIVPIYLLENFSQTPAIVGLIVGIGLLNFAAFNILGGRLSDNIGVKNTTMISLFGVGLTVMSLSFISNFMIFSIIFILSLGFNGIGQTGFSMWALNLSRDHKKAQDVGTYRMIAGIGTIPGLVIGGLIADLIGFEQVFIFSSIIFFISLFAILTLLRKT